MLRVGLTGGIATGKSHVAARLETRGLRVVGLDRVAHALMAPGGAAYADVVEAFGRGILAADASIDRKALGAIVFADAAALARLNALVHPRVRDEEARLAAGLSGAEGAVLVVEAALLVESGMHLRFDRLVVAECGPEEQQRRLMARDRIDAGAAQARLRAQMPVAEKGRFAHRLIDTSGAPGDTDERADQLADELLRLARAPWPRVELSLEAAAALALGGAGGVGALTPAAFLEEAAAGLELERLARRIDPQSRGPWYAREIDAECPPDALSGGVALFAIGRRGADPEYAAAAAYAVARLTHASPACLERAVLAALALQEATCGAPEPPSPAARDLAQRWSGFATRPSDCDAARARVAAARGPVALGPAERESLSRLLAARRP